LGQTPGFNLFDAELYNSRYESVLCLDECREVNTEHTLYVLHVRHAVVRDLLRALLVCVETTIYRSDKEGESEE